MHKCVNGEYFDMTAEEIAVMETPPEDVEEAQPSAEERLEALEAAMLELICGGGDDNG